MTSENQPAFYADPTSKKSFKKKPLNILGSRPVNTNCVSDARRSLL